MPDKNVDVSNRFSQIYKSDTKLYYDSKRFRVRLHTYLKKLLENYNLAQKIQETLGVKTTFYSMHYDIEGFMDSASGLILHSPIDMVKQQRLLMNRL